MSELHPYLDDEARRVSADPNSMAAVVKRAEARRRARRITAGVIALAITGGSIGIAYSAFRTADGGRPAVGPTPGPTPTSDEATPPPVPVSLCDGSGETARAFAFAERLVEDWGQGVQHGGYTVANAQRPCSATSAVTRLFWEPDFRPEAERLRRLLFPYAELVMVPDESAGGVAVILGQDFAERHQEEIAEFGLLQAFMRAREEGTGAEAFLTPRAMRSYDRSPAYLYRYIEAGNYGFHLGEAEVPAAEGIVANRPGTTIFVIISRGGRERYSEKILVKEGPDGGLQIAEAFLGFVSKT